jgi:UDP-glucose 4-epimerase
MKIAITGGAGFIGTNLSRSLLSDGYEVKILDDLSTGLHSNIADGIEFINGSILDVDALNRFVSGSDAVVHLAARGSVPRSIKSPRATHDVNSTGTLNVLEAVRKHDLHYVFSSSSSVYGGNTDLPKTESMPTWPLTPYAASKLSGEALSMAYAKSYNLQVCTFRFFNIFGKWQRPDHAYAAVIPKWIWKAIKREEVLVFGNGQQTRDFTSVSTVVSVLTNALENSITHDGPINLAFGNRISLNQVLNLLINIFPDLKVKYIDSRAGDVTDSQNNPALISSIFPYILPQKFEDALLETSNWFKSNLEKLNSGPEVLD